MAISYLYSGEGITIFSGSGGSNTGVPFTASLQTFSLKATGSKSNQFQILIPSQSTGESEDTIALFITSSGKDARIGIGTQKPESLLEIKSTQTSSKGFADFVLVVPNASASQGNESSRISFVIEDQTLSGSEFTISGSTGAIFSRVLSDPSTTDYQFGSLVFEVDGPSSTTQNTKGLEIGYGLNSFTGDQIASIFTGSIVIGAGDVSPTPGMYVRNYQGDDLAYIGQDIINPSDFESGQLLLYYNGDSNPKIVLRTETRRR